MPTITRKPAAPSAGAAGFAQHVARLTALTTPQLWTLPAAAGETAESADDLLDLAAARFADQVAALTGTEADMWLQGEFDGTETRRRLVAQGAAAIIHTGQPAEPVEAGDDFAEMEAEIAAEAASDRSREGITAKAGLRAKARERALEVYSEKELAAFGDDPMEAWGKDVRDEVETWSPFSATRRADARHIVRCADGTRRYGDGTPARD
jgi:hypothetical protein